MVLPKQKKTRGRYDEALRTINILNPLRISNAPSRSEQIKCTRRQMPDVAIPRFAFRKLIITWAPDNLLFQFLAQSRITLLIDVDHHCSLIWRRSRDNLARRRRHLRHPCQKMIMISTLLCRQARQVARKKQIRHCCEHK